LKGLERRYRLLLKAYPADYRSARGDEILATLLDRARPGQTFPSIADAVDVFGHALRRRASAELEDAATLAAPWALALAAGIAGYVWWQVEPLIPTSGPIGYAAWILAAAAAVTLPDRARRPLIALALVATLATTAIAPIAGVHRPPIWTIMSLLGLGCIAFAGRRLPTLETRLNIAAATVAVILTCKVLSPSTQGYYQPVIARIGAVIAMGVLATAVVAFHRRLRRRSAREALLAGLVLALPTTWLGPIDSIAWDFPVDNLTAARFGRLAHVIVATCAVLCLLALMMHTRPISKAALSGVLAGTAAGFGAFAAVVAWPTHATVAILAMLVTAVLLRTRPRLVHAFITASLMLVACWLVGVYSNDWMATGWANPTRTVVLASMLTIVPCSLAILVGLRERCLAALPSGVWIGYLTLPALLAWGPLLWALAAAAVVGATRQILANR
jgi:hypothetical protein